MFFGTPEIQRHSINGLFCCFVSKLLLFQLIKRPKTSQNQTFKVQFFNGHLESEHSIVGYLSTRLVWYLDFNFIYIAFQGLGTHLLGSEWQLLTLFSRWKEVTFWESLRGRNFVRCLSDEIINCFKNFCFFVFCVVHFLNISLNLFFFF